MKKKYIALVLSVALIAVVVCFGEVFTVHTVTVNYYGYTDITDERELLELSQIERHSSIFAIEEGKIIANIENNYAGNAIRVVDVVRSFPNKVTIYVKERAPIFFIESAKDDTKAVATDINFQRNSVVYKSSIDYTVIAVEGIKVDTNFNTSDFRLINKLGKSLQNLGMTEDGILCFIKSLRVDDSTIVIKLRNGEAKFTLSKTKDIDSQISGLVNQYVNLPISKQANCNLICNF